MEPSAAIELTGSFVKFVGATLAELKRAQVDLDVLRLKGSVLSERLQDLSKVLASVKSDKAAAIADLSTRGVLSSNLKQYSMESIDRAANEQLAIAQREYNRAIEEIALMERRVTIGSWNWERIAVIAACLTTAYLLCDAMAGHRSHSSYLNADDLLFVVFSVSSALSIVGHRWGHQWAIWVFGLLALIFNPIIRLDPVMAELGPIIVRLAAAAMLVGAYVLKPGTNHSSLFLKGPQWGKTHSAT